MGRSSRREPWACASAIVVAIAVQVPLVYSVKARFLPNDWHTLRRQLARSGAVALLSLMLPALLLWLHPRDAGQPQSMPWFLLAIVSCCVSWRLAVVWCRHPLALDPAFARLTRWWRR